MLSRYNVYRPLLPLWGASPNGLQASVERMFQDFETAFTRPLVGTPRSSELRSREPLSQAARHGRARVQLRDRGDSIGLLADLPGLNLGDIELSVEGSVVSLKATPKPDPIPDGFTALRRERQPAALEWSFELPYAIDAQAASATLEQGRLSVSLPKAPEAKVRSIPIKVA